MKQVSKYNYDEKSNVYVKKTKPSKKEILLPDNSFLADLLKKAILVLLLFMVASMIRSSLISIIKPNDGPIVDIDPTPEVNEPKDGGQSGEGETATEKSEDVVIYDPIPKDQYLVLLDPFYLSRVYVTNDVFDIRGEHYVNALVGDSHPRDFGYAGSESKPTYVIYDISKYDFTTLSAVVSVEERSSSKDPDTYGSVFIYGDGSLLYQNAELNCFSTAENIELDISGIGEIKVEIWRSERSDHNIRPLLGNILLSSNES